MFFFYNMCLINNFFSSYLVNKPSPNLALYLLGVHKKIRIKENSGKNNRFNCLSAVLEFLVALRVKFSTDKSEIYGQCLKIVYNILRIGKTTT